MTNLCLPGVGLDPILVFLAVPLHPERHGTAEHVLRRHVSQPPPLRRLGRQGGVGVAGGVEHHFLLQREFVGQVGSWRRCRCLWRWRGRWTNQNKIKKKKKKKKRPLKKTNGKKKNRKTRKKKKKKEKNKKKKYFIFFFFIFFLIFFFFFLISFFFPFLVENQNPKK